MLKGDCMQRKHARTHSRTNGKCEHTSTCLVEQYAENLLGCAVGQCSELSVIVCDYKHTLKPESYSPITQTRYVTFISPHFH